VSVAAKGGLLVLPKMKSLHAEFVSAKIGFKRAVDFCAEEFLKKVRNSRVIGISIAADGTPTASKGFDGPLKFPLPQEKYLGIKTDCGRFCTKSSCSSVSLVTLVGSVTRALFYQFEEVRLW